jgi:hypothetical protein
MRSHARCSGATAKHRGCGQEGAQRMLSSTVPTNAAHAAAIAAATRPCAVPISALTRASLAAASARAAWRRASRSACSTMKRCCRTLAGTAFALNLTCARATALASSIGQPEACCRQL